jgi:hypothetical protein
VKKKIDGLRKHPKQNSNVKEPEERDTRSLPDKLVEDLLKSGFASELQALEVFRAAGWNVSSRSEFYDPVLKIGQELDLYAYLINYGYEDTQSVTRILEVITEFWIEVKKSEAPWIVLRTPESDRDKTLFMVAMNCSPHFMGFPQLRGMRMVAANRSIVERNGWCGHGIHEAFKKPTSPSRWYPAFLKLARASHKARRPAVPKEKDERPKIRQARTLLVLDGPLYSAVIINGKIEVAKISEATIEFAESQS